MLRHLWRLMVLWFVLGMCYATVELLWRGVTYLPMIWVGGLCGLCVGLLNQHPFFCGCRMWQQCLIGTLITLVIEFVSGYILNIKLGLDIWDYSSIPFNLMGQICLPYGILWFFLMPFAVYLDDWLRWKLFYEKKPRGGPLANYVMLFTGA
ncbi:MAG: hypothetical protein DIU81_006275 [[Clostridium] cellulosi]|nr:MAG: hypothetical protein DIU81_05955 [[Clostridium] cellulosi]